ncbi:MAG TPA: hypothetical protein VEB66_07910, partial [Opitutaceae bacterium]|nr:hypothetical protein [Opitutaceae bacterium]
MSFLNRLERKLGRLAVENTTLYILMGQVGFFLLALLGKDLTDLIVLQMDLVVDKGQVWRPFTFIFEPPAISRDAFDIMFIVFGWSLFYLMGNALDEFWGTFRYNIFLGVGWVLTVAVAFLFPREPATALFIGLSVFLAFAYLNPEFVMMIFFILPVKIKWLALITWIGLGFAFMTGRFSTRLMIAASLANFFLFFGADILARMRGGQRRMQQQARQFAVKNAAPAARHTCTVCGKTDRTHPQLDFRYCSKCAGDECYCPEHIFNHVH